MNYIEHDVYLYAGNATMPNETFLGYVDNENDLCQWLLSSDTATNEDTLDMVTYILNGPVMITTIGCGIIGNVVTTYILSLKKMYTPINLYFVVLALWDTLLLISAFCIYALVTVLFGTVPQTGMYIYLYLPFFPLSIIARTGSVWTLIATTVERYLAICKPLYHKRNRSNRRMRKILLTIALCAVIFNINRFLELTTFSCAMENYSIPIIRPTALRLNHNYHLICHVILGFTFIRLGPFALLVILTWLIFHRLKEAPRQIRRSFRAQSYHGMVLQSSLEKKLMFVGLKFIMCMILPTAVDFLEAVITSEKFLASYEFSYLIALGNLLVVLNSALNFPIYLLTCQRFRQQLQSCLTCGMVKSPRNESMAAMVFLMESITKRVSRTTESQNKSSESENSEKISE